MRRQREPRGEVDVGRVDVDGLPVRLTGRTGGTELPASSVSLLEAADVARDGPRRDAEGLADLLEAEARVAEFEDARDGVGGEGRAQIAAAARHPARASQRGPVRRQRRRARVVHVRGEPPEVFPVEVRPLRPLEHELVEVLIEVAVAALPDHLGLGHRASGGVAHRDELGLEPAAADDRDAGDVPGAGAPADVGQRGLDVGPRERRGEGRALQRYSA